MAGNVTAAQIARVNEGRRVDVIKPRCGFAKDAAPLADIVTLCRARNSKIIFIAVGPSQREKVTLQARLAGLREHSVLSRGATFALRLGI